MSHYFYFTNISSNYIRVVINLLKNQIEYQLQGTNILLFFFLYTNGKFLNS